MMELLLPLWLPILLSAAAVWIVSAVVWMALPHHKGDFIGLPDEDGFMDYIRKSGGWHALAVFRVSMPPVRGHRIR